MVVKKQVENNGYKLVLELNRKDPINVFFCFYDVFLANQAKGMSHMSI